MSFSAASHTTPVLSSAARPTVVTLTAEQTFVGRAAKLSPTFSWTRRTTTSTPFIVQRKALQTSSHPIISDWLVMRGQKPATSLEIALPIPTTSTTPSLPSPVSSYSSLSAHSDSVSPYSTRPPGNSTTSASTGVRCRTTIETATDPSGSTTRAMMYTQLGDRLVCISISVEP